MPWSVQTEHSDHFVVHGNRGPEAAFRIQKANLSPKSLETMRKMCRGGKVGAQKLARGGKVKGYAEGTPDAPVSASSDEAPAQSPDYVSMADAAADKYQIPRDLYHGLVKAESNWNPEADAHENYPESHAYGLTQLQPATAKEMGVTNIKDPSQQLEGGAKYLRQHYNKFGSWEKAVAAYHDGPEAVAQNGIPSSLRPYLDNVLHHATSGKAAQPEEPFKQGNVLEEAAGPQAGQSAQSDDEAQGQALTSFLKNPRSIEQAPPSDPSGPSNPGGFFHPTPDNTVDPTLPPAAADTTNLANLAQVDPSSAQNQPEAPGQAQAPQLADPTQPQSPFPAIPTPPDYDKLLGVNADALKAGQEGVAAKATAQGQQADELKGAYTDHLTKMQVLQDKMVADVHSVTDRMHKIQDDVANAKIDPNHFWDSKSTGQKMAAGIGMILAGIGSGLTGQPNLAAQFLQRGIDRDIDAQRANLGKKFNLLSGLQREFGNIQEATVAARSYQTANLAGMVGLAGARAGSAEAMANAKIVQAQLMQSSLAPMVQLTQAKYQNQMQQLQMEFTRNVMQSTVAGGAGAPGYVPSGTPPPMLSEPSLKGISELQKAKGESYVNLGNGRFTYAKPGVADEVNRNLPELDNMNTNLAVMEQLGKNHAIASTGVWPTKESEQFKVAHSALNLSLNRLMGQSRFTETEQGIYGPMLAEPKKFLVGEAGQANINALRRLVSDKRLAEYKRIGLHVPQRPQETPIAGAN